MGEVYRARDTKLGRDVALKILPDLFAQDPDRLTRFQREAHVLASLNHPHIAAIYGFDESTPMRPGQPPIRALALEFVEGPTLAERIAQAAIPVDEALQVARQIVEALDAAHAQGVVHRDLKPANIKLRPDGTVKVLDFGLAKSIGDSADPAHSPTITAVSRSGVILGTAAYMSPEQARGKPVDKRCDIWAFGCVLYEMLAARSAFGGETITDTLSAIISREPDWTLLPAATPAGVRRLLQHTLEKDPKERLRDIGDAAYDLRSAPIETAGAGSRARPSLKAWRIAAIAATAASLALGFLAWRNSAPTPAIQRTQQLMRVTSDSGFTTEPTISADGRFVAYASDRAGAGNLDIWVQQTDGGGAVRLTADPTDDRQPSISPDGIRIAFRSDRSGGGVYVMPALGGDARLIAPQGRAPKFSPDGRSLAFWTGGWLAARGIGTVRRTYIVDVNGGTPTQVAQGLASSGDPVWSPDGKSLLVYGREATAGNAVEPNWWLVPMGGGTPRRTNAYEALASAGIDLATTDAHPYPEAWTDEGVLFAATTRDYDVRSIWRMQLDARTAQVAGPPRRVTMGTTFDERPGSAPGRVVFAGLIRQRLILGLPLDANAGRSTGGVKVLRSDVADVARSTVSQDGSLIAFPRYDLDTASVWIRDVRSGIDRQIASTRRTPLNPVISSDGRWVAYTVTAAERGGGAGPGAGFVLQTEGGSPRKVCDDCEIYQWLQSNRHVVAMPSGGPTVHLIEIETGKVIEVFPPGGRKAVDRPGDSVVATGGTFGRPLVSPDERLIAFTHRNRTYVTQFAGPRGFSADNWQLVLTPERAGERICGWSPDGRLLYFLLERDGFRCLHALRLNASAHPVGNMFVVHHLHDGSREWGSTGFSSAVVNGLFVFNQVGLTGNIWLLR